MTTLVDTPVAARTAPRGEAPSLMLAAICAIAAHHGIRTITVAYDGYGDEGQIETVTLQGEPDEETQLAPEIAMPDDPCTSWAVPYQGDASEVETTFARAIDDLGYEMLAQKHAGWEDGEGAFGELVVDVASRKATLEHSVRFIETESHTHEWEG